MIETVRGPGRDASTADSAVPRQPLPSHVARATVTVRHTAPRPAGTAPGGAPRHLAAQASEAP
jgi:hypothetical protein